MSLQPLSSVSVFFPDGTQLLSGGIGAYDNANKTITCATFTGPVFPVPKETGYIILFQDNDLNWWGYLNCQCISAVVYKFVLGTQFFSLLADTQPSYPPSLTNVTAVSVSAGEFYLILPNGTGNWNQDQAILNCGAFTVDNLPTLDSDGYIISFTDSTGNQQTYNSCSCIASGYQSAFSLG